MEAFVDLRGLSQLPETVWEVFFGQNDWKIRPNLTLSYCR